MTVNSADCLTALQERSGFCEEWQQRKKVKSVEVNEASPDTFNEGIHQSPHKLFIKIRTSSWSAYIIPWNIWYNQKKHLVQHKNNERLLNENSIPFELHRHKSDIIIWSTFSNWEKATAQTKPVLKTGLSHRALLETLFCYFALALTFSWQRSLSYRNQSIALQSKSVDWVLYERNLRHKRVTCVKIFKENQTILGHYA